MAQKYESLALEFLGRDEDGTLMPWMIKHLQKISSYPWTPSRLLPKGRALQASIALGEIMGLSGTGKSTLTSSLEEQLVARGLRAVVMPELEHTDSTGRKINKSDIRNLRHLGIEMENYALEYIKLGIWSEAIVKVLNLMIGDSQLESKGSPIVAVCERGPNDGLVHLKWVKDVVRVDDLGLSARLSKDLLKEYNFEWLRLLLSTIAHSENVDFVILFGGNWQTTQARRIAMGQEPEGGLVNSKTRPYFESAYGWWLGSIFPLIRKRHGTGLLIVDGDRSQQENLDRVVNYISEVARLKNS